MTVTASGIWTPDAGDDYALTTDLAAMASSVETAIVNNVSTAVAKSGSAVANHGALPMTGNTAGDQRVTTDTRIVWTWDGTRWIAVAGKLPWCHVLTTGVTNLGTSYTPVNFQAGSSSGAHWEQTFTVPAGCTGLYQISFGGRVTPNAANMIGAVFVNGAEAAGTSFTSGGQDWVSQTCVLSMTAGSTFQVRVRVFSGTGTLHQGATLDVTYLHAV